MHKLEAIKYFLSKIEWDSADAFGCIREIVEDLEEPIDKKYLDELIDECDDFED